MFPEQGPVSIWRPSFPGMGIPMLKIRRSVRPSCLVHPGLRYKRRVSEIDLSQPRHEALFCIVNNRHGVTITTHAIKRHFLIWMTTARQPTERRCSLVLTLKYIFICVYWWTRQRIHNTLIVVDRYLRLMGDKTIPDSAEPRLESFYPPFVAGIDLPHQGVVDSYNL